jgi:hypothetical protein
MTYELNCQIAKWLGHFGGLLTVSRGLFSYELSAMNISFACGLLLTGSCLLPTAGPDSKKESFEEDRSKHVNELFKGVPLSRGEVAFEPTSPFTQQGSFLRLYSRCIAIFSVFHLPVTRERE